MRRRGGACLAAVLLAACASGGGGRSTPAATAPRSALAAGAASRVISPEVRAGGPPVRLAGFGPGRDAQGVHDDLYARALVLEAGGRSLALVALDLIGFFHDDIVKIRGEIRERHPEAAVDEVLVASTHTHAGPDVIGLWTPPERSVDAAYVARVRALAADAVAEAWSRRRPARLSFAETRLPNLIADSRLPTVIDDRALLLKVDAADGGGTIATLTNFADHPEALGRENGLVSSDYPGALRRELEGRYGGVALFFSADIGGLLTPLDAGEVIDPDTGRPVPRKSYRLTELLGQTIARALESALQTAAPPVAGAAIEVRSRVFQVPLGNARFRKGLEAGRIWPRAVDPAGAITSEAAVVTLRAAGAVVAQLACVPGEIYPELVVGGIQDPQDPGADFQGAPKEPSLGPMMAGEHRFVLGLCDDELGYIIPLSEWDEAPPFAYGRDGPQYGEGNSAGPQTAPTVLRVFGELLR